MSESRPSRLRAARTMISLAWQADRPRSIAALGLYAGQALFTALFAYWLALLVDGLADRSYGRTIAAAVLLALSVTAELALDYIGSRLKQSLNDRAHHLVQRRLIELVGRTPTLEIHETPEHLTQLELLDSESWEFGNVVPSLLDVANAVVRIVIVAVILASVHPLLLALPAFGLPMFLLSKKTNGLYNLGSELAAANTRRANDLWDLATTTGAAKEIRLFGLRSELLKRFHSEQREIRRINTRVTLQGRAIGLLTRSVFLAGYFAAIVFVVRLAVDGRVSIGAVVMTAVLAGQVLGLMSGSADTFQWALRTLTAATRYVYLEQVSSRSVERVSSAAVVPSRLSSGIRLEQVSYAYPSGVQALQDVDLELPAGSTIALVGDNGAGKTTLVKLLAGLYRPTAGRITIDGTDLATLDPDAWRRHVSAGFQDHARLEFVVRETVGVGQIPLLERDSADAEVTAAIGRAGASDLLEALPRRLDTQLGPQWPLGIDLSGGQWQKLAIARAMMRTTPLLLLLDEPTAALDAETEHRLFERWTAAAAVARRQTGAVTILVSHRFSTVLMADLIVVVAGGRFAEVGTHAELMARGGTYAELFELQASSYR